MPTNTPPIVAMRCEVRSQREQCPSEATMEMEFEGKRAKVCCRAWIPMLINRDGGVVTVSKL